MSRGLEEIKTLRTVNQREFDNDKNINKSLDIIEDELKVLEIINEKLVDMFKLYNCKIVEEYNDSQYRDCKLTLEEFDLLKRWTNGNISSNNIDL